MVFTEHLNDYKVIIANHNQIKESYKKFYIFWVELFLHYLEKNSYDEKKLSRSEMLRNFSKHLHENNKYRDWQINQAIDAVNLLYTLIKNKDNDSISLEFVIRQIHNAIKLKHYSGKTEKSYIYWIKQFHYYIKKSFSMCNSMDVKNFLTHLAKEKNVAASTQNQAFNAILFLFRHVLYKELENMEETLRAKRNRKIPTVLTGKEVAEVFKYLNNENLLISKILYGSGLRLMECMTLRIKDIDLSRKIITVHSGKGDKDRIVMIPETIIQNLHNQIEHVKNIFEKDKVLDNNRVKTLPLHLPLPLQSNI